MLRALLCGAVVAVTVAAVFTPVSAQDTSTRHASTLTSWPISPAVVATFIGHRDVPAMAPGQLPPRELSAGPVTLDLLVLWRGAPGWFANGGHNSESGGGDSKGNVNVHLEKGGVVLDASLDVEKRMARIAGTDVPLGDANLVMVDRVDVPGGLTIFGTGNVERRVDALPNGLYDVLRNEPDLVSFLRCDASLPVPPLPRDVPAETAAALTAYMQQALNSGCARMLGK